MAHRMGACRLSLLSLTHFVITRSTFAMRCC